MSTTNAVSIGKWELPGSAYDAGVTLNAGMLDDFWHAISDNSPLGIALFSGTDRRLLWANTRFCNWLDLRQLDEDFQGYSRRLQDLIPSAGEPDDALAVAFEETAKSGRRQDSPGTYRAVGPRLDVMWWRWSLCPIRSEVDGVHNVLLQAVRMTNRPMDEMQPSKTSATTLAAGRAAKRLRGRTVASRPPAVSEVAGAVPSEIRAPQRTEEVLEFLVEAGEILASSLDYHTTLRTVANLAVPRLADWCTVEIIEEDGSIHRLAVAHKDPAKAELARELQRRYPPSMRVKHGAARMLRTGQPEYYPEIPETFIEESARDPEHFRLFRQLGLQSYMGFPLIARGRIVGVISFISAESGRRYEEADLYLAEELAHRAALAVENARLYQAAQQEIAERRRAEQSLRQNEERLRFILESAHVGTWDWDVVADRVVWSDTLRDIHGLGAEPHDSSLDDLLRNVHPEDKSAVRRTFAQAFRSGGDYMIEYRVVHSDGHIGWVETKGRVIREEGRPVRMAGVSMDITARKQTDQEVKRLNRDLKRRIEELQTLLEVLPVGICVAQDAECETVSANPAAAAMLGAPNGAGIRIDEPRFQAFRNGQEVKSEDLPMRKAARQAVTVPGVELSVMSGPNGPRHLLEYASPLYDETGKVRGCLGVFVDITDRKRAEEALRESEDRFRGTFENAAVGIAHLSTDGTWLRVNQKLCTTIGYSREELLRMTFQDITHEDDLSANLSRFERLMRGGIENYTLEQRYYHRDGHEVWVNLTAALQRDPAGRPQYCIAVVEDITARKLAERKLKELNETLEQRVRKRTRWLVRYQKQLRALASELTLAEQRERRQLAAELHDYLAQLLVVCKMKVGRVEKAVRSVRALTALSELDEILDQSLEYTRTLVTDLSPTILYEAGLPTAINWLAKQMRRHGLDVRVMQGAQRLELPEEQAILMFHAIRELLFNVVKHAKVREATVQIERTASELRVLVADEGVGFDLSARMREPSVTGRFGLFNVQERLEALSGRFEIDSAPGEGTRARLVLPLRRTSSRPEPAPAAAPKRAATAKRSPATRRGRRRARILLADDHAMVRQGLRSLLDQCADLEVVGEAADGAEAVSQVEALRPDVVVLDVNMPVMNGIETTRRIKEIAAQTTVIGLSVHDDREMAQSMQEAGAAAYLTKGGPPEELYRAIRAAALI